MSGTSWLSVSPADFSFVKSVFLSAQEGDQWPPLGIIVFWHFAYNNPSTAQWWLLATWGYRPAWGFRPAWAESQGWAESPEAESPKKIVFRRFAYHMTFAPGPFPYLGWMVLTTMEGR